MTETPPDTPLKGLTVLITGAADVQGMAIARVLGILGANLHLADGDEAALIEATRAYRDETRGGIKLHTAQLDRAVGLEALAMECEDADVLIHAAGAFPNDGEEDATRRAWTKRVLGALPLITEAASGFEDRDRGLVLLALPARLETCKTPHPAMAAAALRALCEDETTRNELPDGVTLETVEAGTPDAIAARVRDWWTA